MSQYAHNLPATPTRIPERAQVMAAFKIVLGQRRFWSTAATLCYLHDEGLGFREALSRLLRFSCSANGANRLSCMQF